MQVSASLRLENLADLTYCKFTLMAEGWKLPKLAKYSKLLTQFTCSKYLSSICHKMLANFLSLYLQKATNLPKWFLTLPNSKTELCHHLPNDFLIWCELSPTVTFKKYCKHDVVICEADTNGHSLWYNQICWVNERESSLSVCCTCFKSKWQLIRQVLLLHWNGCWQTHFECKNYFEKNVLIWGFSWTFKFSIVNKLKNY